MTAKCVVFEVVDRGRNRGGLAGLFTPTFENHLIAVDDQSRIIFRSPVYEMHSDISTGEQKITSESYAERARVTKAFEAALNKAGWEVFNWKLCEWLDIYTEPAEHGVYSSTEPRDYDSALFKLRACHIELLTLSDGPVRILQKVVNEFSQNDMIFRWKKNLDNAGKQVGYIIDGDFPWPVVHLRIREAFSLEDWQLYISDDSEWLFRKPKKRVLPSNLRSPFKWPKKAPTT